MIFVERMGIHLVSDMVLTTQITTDFVPMGDVMFVINGLKEIIYF